jgi:formylmethanofuran dehydrogenase subunit B
MSSYQDVVCAYCGCLCDDLEVEVENNHITKVKGACLVGRNKLMYSQDHLASIRVNGQPASLEAALDEAARILLEAKNPLVYGLSSTSTEAQREAIALTEMLKCTIDNPSSYCHGPGVLARQHVGIVTCTLGEVKNRADLVIFWAANPMESHQRHLPRYSVQPKGLFIPEGRKGRKVVVIDVRPTPTSRNVDLFLQVTPGQDFEIATALRALVKGLPLEGVDESGLIAGVPVEQWQKVATMMKECHYGAVFFGIGLTQSRGKDRNVEQLLTLVAELNQFTRFHALANRGHGNVNGANQILAWQTGYPLAVNFSRGYPRFNPGEFSVVDMLMRRDCDAAIIVATDPGAHLPNEAVDYLKTIPTIFLEPHENTTTQWANVVLPVAPVGVGVAGTFYRLDNVALRLDKLVDFPFPSDEEVLRSIKERVANAQDRQRTSVRSGEWN